MHAVCSVVEADEIHTLVLFPGLLGDATEEFVEQLSSGKDEDVDEEKEYKMAEVLSRCGGLDAILSR